MRINIQLIDGKTGAHLWAERYDGALNDVLTFQDRIVESIIASLPLHIDADQWERLKLGETDNPRAFDAYLQGWELFIRRTPEYFAAAVPHFKRAIVLDPNDPGGYISLAFAHNVCGNAERRNDLLSQA